VDTYEILRLSDIYLELADEFLEASQYLENAVRQLVGDTFPEDPPLVDFQARQKGLVNIAQKAASRGLDPEEVRAQMTDLMGARLICLHLQQIDDLLGILGELESRSIIRINKTESWIEDPQPDGYRGVHVDAAIRLPKHKKAGVEIKEVPCEIQIRTLIQHAWAERAHGLIYKPEYEPSDRIRNLFRIESLRLHGHQKTMDALWEMALWERGIRETDESINPLSIKEVVREFNIQLTDHMAMTLYRAVRSSTPVEKIDELRQILSNREIQDAIRSIYGVQLGREPDIADQLVYGSLITSDPEGGRFLTELDVIASPEFRGKEMLPFEFSVIGRPDHTFTSHQERAGGWFAYHTRDCYGQISGHHTDGGVPDGVELTALGKKAVFRAAYPIFSLRYPGRAILADFTLEGNSHFFVLATTEEGLRVFFEFGSEYEDVSETSDPREGTRYVRNPINTSNGDPTIRVDLIELMLSTGLGQGLHLIHGFYCEANPQMVLRRVEVHKKPFSES
jgi:ppGpp synthetase/RelA/SpoT-type nucleotidyltranferase